MAGFRYFTSGGSSEDRFRHYLSLAGGSRKSVAGQFLIEDGFTGSLSISGLGFEPEALLLFGTALNNDFDFHGQMHWGMAAGASLDQWGGGFHFPYLDAPHHRSSRWSADRIIAQASDPDGISGTEAELTSFDSDGFTLDVIVAPHPSHSGLTPSGSWVQFLAIAGQGGNYAVGTSQSPLSLGTEAITGLGFEPNVVFLSSTQRYDDVIAGDGLSNSTASAMGCFGLAEVLGGQYSIWCGATTGDIYSSNAAQDGACLSMWQDAQDVPGPFFPGLLAEAVLDSYDADGFTLDWTTVATEEYYYSWFAAENYTQADRWTYNHPTSVVGRVSTRRKPKALIFFSTDIAINGSQNSGTVGGASIGLGVAGQHATMTGDDQYASSIQDITQAAFFIPQSGRQTIDDHAFGCYSRRSGSTPANTMRDRGAVQPYGRDHLLRLHTGP